MPCLIAEPPFAYSPVAKQWPQKNWPSGPLKILRNNETFLRTLRFNNKHDFALSEFSVTVREASKVRLFNGTNDEESWDVDDVFADGVAATSVAVGMFSVNDDAIDVSAGNVGDDSSCVGDIHGIDEGIAAEEEEDGAISDVVITTVRDEDTGSKGRKWRWSTSSQTDIAVDRTVRGYVEAIDDDWSRCVSGDVGVAALGE